MQTGAQRSRRKKRDDEGEDEGEGGGAEEGAEEDEEEEEGDPLAAPAEVPAWLASNAPAEVNFALGQEVAAEALGEELPPNRTPRQSDSLWGRAGGCANC